MPFKPPVVAGIDLRRARQIVRSLAALESLNSDDAETVARIIAQCFAEGRQQGLDIAKDWGSADCHTHFRSSPGSGHSPKHR